MKKRLLSLLCTLALCLCLLPVTAAAAGPDWTYDPGKDTLTWTDPESSQPVTLSSVTADGEGNLTIGSNQTFSGALDLSGTITDSDGKPYQIVAIGEHAFYSCSSLGSVTLPASLTSIGDSAFAYSGLTSVDLGNCTSLTSIENGAFFYCQNLGSVDLSSCTSLTSIGVSAFYSCSSLGSVTLPASLTSIGDSAFGKSGLGSVDLGNCTSLTSIENSAFYYCQNLGSVDLSSCTSLTSIGEYAFMNSSLTSVDLSSCTSLTSIGERAFYSCSSLGSVTLPASLTSIGDSAFGNSGLTSVDLSSCTSLTSIGNQAFYSCSNLDSVDLSNCTSLTSIGEHAFENSGLTSVDLSSCTSLTSIGNQAFMSSGLTSVDLSACTQLEAIGEGPFANCTSLTGITVAEGNEHFTVVDGVLFDKEQTRLIQYPAGNTATSCRVPETVEEIGGYAFYGCKNLTLVDLPGNLTSIGNEAFDGCLSLTQLVMLAETPPALSGSLSDNSTFSILVPAGRVEDYKAAFRWSSYANQIQALPCYLSVTPNHFVQELVQGETPTPVTFTVANSGNATVSILRVALVKSTNFDLNVTGMDDALEPGKATTFTVTLKSGLEPGSYETSVQLDSAFLEQPITSSLICTVKSVGIQASPDPLDFGTVTEGYTEAPAAKEVTITNTGNQDVTVDLPTSTNYTVTAGTGFTNGNAALSPGSKAQFTVQPKTGLGVGTYQETLEMTGTYGVRDDVELRFVVTRPTGGGSSGGSTTTPTISQQIITRIKAAKDGDTVEATLKPSQTKLDKEVFETLSGRDVTLVLHLNDGVDWTIYGLDIAADANLTDLDMGVTMDTHSIPVTVFNAVTGEVDTIQISLKHNGEFGFTLTLTAPLGEEYAGLWANLYYYNQGIQALEFQSASKIGVDGTADFDFSHASQYAIVIDTKSHEPQPEPLPEPLPFTDVPEGAWYYDGVVYVYENGLMAGTSATTFAPDTTTSRAMVATILWRMAGSPVVDYTMTYTDVDPVAWYGEAVRWATSEGVVTGYGNGLFGTNDPITREQLAVMLYRYAQTEGYDVSVGEDTNILSYTDVGDLAEYAIPAMQWACGAGVINGTGDGSTLTPQGNATRAQAAVMLQRFCEEYMTW